MIERNEITENKQKQENYREQFVRLKRALDSKFFLEAVFIEYSIIEDRTESVLRHANKWDSYLKKRGRYSITLDSKIAYIKHFANEKKSVANKYFSDMLLDNIIAWKEARNRLIHALMKQRLTTEELADIAINGYDLTKKIRNRVNSFNRATNGKLNFK